MIMTLLRLYREYAGRRSCLFFRTFSILFIVIYFAPVLFAAEVFIPSNLAQVRDRTKGTNGKTVVIVEAAHVNYEAQKSIANILQDLAKNELLRDIFVEGGWGDVSLASLRRLTTPEHCKEVAEEYLRQGKISGGEYLSLATDLDIRLWGVEDPKLYEANMKVFLEFSTVRAKLLNDLKEFQSRIQAIQPKILTPAMTEILAKRRDFEDQTVSLLDYAQFLMSHLPGTSKRFPHLAGLVSFSGQDGTYDPDKLVVEKKSVVQFLSQRLTKPELEDILILEGQKTTEGELAFLEELLKKVRGLPGVERLPAPNNLIHYRNILRQVVRMDTAAIFPEFEQAEQEALNAQKPSPEQAAFMEVVRGIAILQKLFALRLTEDEFEALSSESKVQSLKLKGQTLSLKLETWNSLLMKAGSKYSIPYRPFDTKEFSRWIPVALSFYQTARAREKAMIENLDREMKDRDLLRAGLVAGGFHSRNFFNSMKAKGYTVILVSPRFTPSDDRTQHEHYLEVLKSTWTGAEVSGPKFQDPSSKFAIQSSKIN